MKIIRYEFENLSKRELDTLVILKWIKEAHSADVIAFCADIRQEEEWEGLEKKALIAPISDSSNQ